MCDRNGLFLLVSPSGGKWWRVSYRIKGKQKTLSLGVYPEVGLREARSRRDELRSLLANGIDPGEQRKLERARQRSDRARALAETRFSVDNDGALSFLLGDRRRLVLTVKETTELREFLDATRAISTR